MPLVLIIAGSLLIAVGSLWGLVQAFRQSVLWGLGYLFLPPVALVFLILHWSKAWRPLVLVLIGIGLLVAGISIAPHDAGGKPAVRQDPGITL